MKTAKYMQEGAIMQGISGWNIYLISMNTLEDIKKIASKTLGLNVFKDEVMSGPIEIYMKSPHSKDYLYTTYREEFFFSEKGRNAFLKKAEKISTMVEIVDDKDTFEAKIIQNSSIINAPIVIMAIDQVD